MNKVVHALVYVILALSCAALFFEVNLFEKKTLLTDRNRMLEDYIVKLAGTIEKADASRPSSVPEAKKDISPVEARLVDTPETENLLEEYPVQLEEGNLATFDWRNERLQLRNLYYLENGEKVPDPVNPGDFMKSGKGTMVELLDQLFDRAKAQQAKLNTTRAELAMLRTKLVTLAEDYNKLKPPARQDKITIEEERAKIPPLEQEKQAAIERANKIKTQVDDLTAEVTSLKDEVTTAKDETEAVREDLEKSQKLVDQLKKLLQQKASQPAASVAANATSAASLTAGVKGKVVSADNKLMFAIVEFSDDAMKELLGPERNGALPMVELGLRRKGFTGAAGEYVGRIRLRQAVAGKNFVVADILGDWQQTTAEVGDAVFAD